MSTVTSITTLSQDDFNHGCENLIKLGQHGLSNVSLVGDVLTFNQNDLVTRVYNFVVEFIEQIAHDFLGALYNPRAFNHAKISHIENLMHPQIFSVITHFKEMIEDEGMYTETMSDINAKLAMNALLNLEERTEWGSYMGYRFSQTFFSDLNLNANFRQTAQTPRADWAGPPLTREQLEEISRSKELSNSLPLSKLNESVANSSPETLVAILSLRDGVILGLDPLSSEMLQAVANSALLRAKLSITMVRQIVHSDEVSQDSKKACLQDMRETIRGFGPTDFMKELLKSKAHVQKMTAYQVRDLAADEDELTLCKLLDLSQGEVRDLDYQAFEMLAFTIYAHYPKLVARMHLQEQMQWMSALPPAARIDAKRLINQV